MKKRLNFIAWLVVLSAISYFCWVNWGISLGVVKGPSMEPTYHDLDKVIVNRYTLLFREPVRGEVVVIWNPQEDGHDIKRIAAVPGDTVETTGAGKQYTLGKDQYFVVGDNAAKSYDSRYYGPIHRVQILGVVNE